MEVCLLGSGSASGWPVPFCKCDACEEARRRRGPNIRSRSGAMIDDDFKIDFCPDTFAQLRDTGRDLNHLKVLVFTHQHRDHIAPFDMNRCVPEFARMPAEKIDIYGSAPVLEIIQKECSRLVEISELHLLKEHVPVTLENGDEILPLLAEHVEGAMTLRIVRGGKSLFYGHDSCEYPEETLNALEERGPLDIALMDCNAGGIELPNRRHMNAFYVEKMRDELARRGAITDKTRVIATHFSHKGKWLHEELLAHFTPRGIEVAYDGMTIHV